MLTLLILMAVLAQFGLVLTLPGIAGIILTVGMAVDANVLINERIREELRKAKTSRAAVDGGLRQRHAHHRRRQRHHPHRRRWCCSTSAPARSRASP